MVIQFSTHPTSVLHYLEKSEEAKYTKYTKPTQSAIPPGSVK